MYQKYKDLLIEALLSGKYKQGQKRLRSDDEYCCLGVLCDVSGLGHWTFLNIIHNQTYHYEDRKSFVRLSQNLRLKIGLSLENESLMIDLNDRKKVSFKEIANFVRGITTIEENNDRIP